MLDLCPLKNNNERRNDGYIRLMLFILILSIYIPISVGFVYLHIYQDILHLDTRERRFVAYTVGTCMVILSLAVIQYVYFLYLSREKYSNETLLNLLILICVLSVPVSLYAMSITLVWGLKTSVMVTISSKLRHFAYRGVILFSMLYLVVISGMTLLILLGIILSHLRPEKENSGP